MSGVNLLELQCDDLVDVLHYMFEEDVAAATSEEVEAKDSLRIRIYEDLYNQKYKYAIPSKRKSRSGFDTSSFDLPIEDDLGPIDDPLNQEVSKQTKGYVPPTEFKENSANPYQGILDAPLG